MQKKIKIWYQGYLEVNSLPDYQNLLKKHITTLEDKNFTVSIHGMPKDFFAGTKNFIGFEIWFGIRIGTFVAGLLYCFGFMIYIHFFKLTI